MVYVKTIEICIRLNSYRKEFGMVATKATSARKSKPVLFFLDFLDIYSMKMIEVSVFSNSLLI